MSIGGAIINYKELKDLLQITLSLLIINDPFPAYEKLSLSNIGFSIFLFSKFVPGGARSFGLPGFP